MLKRGVASLNVNAEARRRAEKVWSIISTRNSSDEEDIALIEQEIADAVAEAVKSYTLKVNDPKRAHLHYDGCPYKPFSDVPRWDMPEVVPECTCSAAHTGAYWKGQFVMERASGDLRMAQAVRERDQEIAVLQLIIEDRDEEIARLQIEAKHWRERVKYWRLEYEAAIFWNTGGYLT